MRREVIRWSLAVVLVVAAAMFPAAGIAFAIQTGQRSKVDAIDTRDREFLMAIRFANLWEIPMSTLALERGTTQEVKDAVETMHSDHIMLNTVVGGLADQFGVTLPAQAKSSQQTWMAEISSKQGEDFNQVFVEGSARRTAACSN